MSFRSTIIVAILLAALGLYAYFGEYKGGKKKEEQKENEKVLLQVKKDDVAEIKIEEAGEPIRLVPVSQDVWQLTSPIKSRADQSTVDRILGDFEKLKYKEIVDEQPKDLSVYELDKPKAIVRLGLKNKGERTITIGAKNPVEDINYVRLDRDPRVYAVESSIGDVAGTSLFDLRDKKLTDFSSDKASSLEVKTPKQDLLFQKDAGIWKMKKPVDSPASDTEVTSLLSSLETLRASEFVDDANADPAKYGLQTPSAEVTLLLDKGLQQKVLFGNKDGDQIYCQVAGNPGIAKVSDSFSNAFSKNLEDWREKKLVIFNRFDTEKVRIKTADKEYQFSKNKEEKWSEQSPQKGDVDTEKMQDLLEKLENAEIAKYGDSATLNSPGSMEVFLSMRDWQDKVTTRTVNFGKVEGNTQEAKNEDYNTIVLVDATLQPSVVKALSEIKPKAPAAAEKKK